MQVTKLLGEVGEFDQLCVQQLRLLLGAIVVEDVRFVGGEIRSVSWLDVLNLEDGIAFSGGSACRCSSIAIG